MGVRVVFEFLTNFSAFYSRVVNASFGILFLVSCGIKSSIEVTTAGAGASGITISKVRPIEAKPFEIVTIEGSNFSVAKDLRARFTLSDGASTDVPLTIIDRSKASFVMPEGVGLGLKSMTIVQGASKEIASLRLVANTDDNELPIIIDDSSEICSTKRYIDRNGDEQTGTKDCSAQSSKACEADGEENCVVDGSTFKAVATANLSPGSIKLGVTIAGVAGTVIAESHSDCASDGATNCVAVTSYPAALATGAASKILSGQTLAGVAGNVTLPAAGKVYTGISYGVAGTSITGSLTIPAAGNVLSTAPAYGDPGAQLTPSLANRGTWDLTSSFPGGGYYMGVSNLPAAATIATGTSITGVGGSATLSPANCSSNGAVGCVTTATYKSADLTNLSEGNVKNGVTIAGTVGQYPNSTYRLSGSSGVDLTSSIFNTQIKSPWTFQYFGSDGTRYTGTGDPETPEPTMIRAGKTVAGVVVGAM